MADFSRNWRDEKMPILKQVFNSIVRNKGRSLILVSIAFLFVCFLDIYFGSIVQNKDMLNSLGDKIPVTATITSIDGGKSVGLAINEKKIVDFSQLNLMDYILTTESYGNIEVENRAGEKERVSVYISGSNTLAAYTMDQEKLTMPFSEAETLLAGSEALCLLNQDYLNARDVSLEVGDIVRINLFQATYDEYGYAYKFDAVTSSEITVAGFYQGSDEIEQPNVICPLEWLKAEYTNVNALFTYTSAKGTVRNPLELNELKDRAKELGFKQVDIQAQSSAGSQIALVMDDRLFIESATQITRNVQILKIFVIPIIILVLLLEALVFFFSIRSRKKEIYIARCLGKRKSVIVLELILENFLLALAGGGAAAILFAATGINGLLESVVIAGGFMCFELLGSLVPAISFSRMNPMEIFQSTE